VELAKVWRAAFDDTSSPSTTNAPSSAPVRVPARQQQQQQQQQRKQEIESVYVGGTWKAIRLLLFSLPFWLQSQPTLCPSTRTGKDSQCFLCGVSPLPSALHLPPPSEDAAECIATDACMAESVPRTAQGALESAQAAAPEPLLLPPAAKYSLPLMVRVVWLYAWHATAPSLVRGRLTFPPFAYTQKHRKLLTPEPSIGTNGYAEGEEEDEPYPELPTVNLLAYDLFVYCTSQEQQQDPLWGKR